MRDDYKLSGDGGFGYRSRLNCKMPNAGSPDSIHTGLTLCFYYTNRSYLSTMISAYINTKLCFFGPLKKAQTTHEYRKNPVPNGVFNRLTRVGAPMGPAYDNSESSCQKTSSMEGFCAIPLSIFQGEVARLPRVNPFEAEAGTTAGSELLVTVPNNSACS